MSNIYRATTIGSVINGLFLMMLGNTGILSAQLTAPGSTLGAAPQTAGEVLHGAAPLPADAQQAMVQIIVGVLLVALALVVHALHVHKQHLSLPRDAR